MQAATLYFVDSNGRASKDTNDCLSGSQIIKLITGGLLDGSQPIMIIRQSLYLHSLKIIEYYAITFYYPTISAYNPGACCNVDDYKDNNSFVPFHFYVDGLQLVIDSWQLVLVTLDSLYS